MTIYSHTVTFQDVERIQIEYLVKQAIEKFKSERANDESKVPWVLVSILEKLEKADMKLMSQTDFSGINPVIRIFDK